MANRVVDESIALYEEMYTRICEENGPADPVLQGIVSDLAQHGAGDLDRAERWAQWLLITYAHTYATVIL
jgi:hypothetical protein